MNWNATASRSESPQAALERRTEARQAAAGSVCFEFEDPLPTRLECQLLDTSSSGFRAAHHCSALHNGQQVSFRHSLARGIARVVWTRISPTCIETGFLILEQEQD